MGGGHQAWRCLNLKTFQQPAQFFLLSLSLGYFKSFSQSVGQSTQIEHFKKKNDYHPHGYRDREFI